MFDERGLSSAGREFYVAGGTLHPDAPSYIVRQADADLLSALRAREFCYVLTSRQMGKSSLMQRTALRLRHEGAVVLTLDLTKFGHSVTLEQWYFGMLRWIGRQTGLPAELEGHWRTHSALGPVQCFFDALTEILPAHISAPIVVFIDEIDTVRGLAFSTDDFFAAIRTCWNGRVENAALDRLTFCLLGVASPSDLIHDVRTTPFNVGRRIELTDFTAEEAAPMMRGFPALRPVIASSLLNRVLYWTGGHPYLTQRLCQALAERSQRTADPMPLLRPNVDSLCAELFFGIRSRQAEPNLSFVADILLHSSLDRPVVLEIYGRVRQGRRVPDDPASPIVALLRLSGICRVRQGTLSLRNRIYARVFDSAWIESALPDAELLRQRRAFRRGVERTIAAAAAVTALFGALAAFAVQKRAEAIRSANVADANARESRANALRAEQSSRESAALTTQARNAERRAVENGLRADRGARQALSQKRTSDAVAADNKRLALERKRALDTALAANAEADRNLYVSNLNMIQRDWDVGNIAHIQELLSDAHRYARRGFEWGYWYRLCHLDIRTLRGHTAVVTSVCCSPDGRQMLSASVDHKAKLWNLSTGHCVRTFAGHTDIVTCACFSGDGTQILTGSYDGTAKVWDIGSGRAIRTFPGRRGPVYSVAFSADGQRVLTGSFDNIARLWDLRSGQTILRMTGHSQAVTSVAFAPAGDRIVTGSMDRTARVWSAASGQEIRTLSGHTKAVYRACFSPDGLRVLTAGDDATARLWDAESGRLLRTFSGHTDGVLTAAFRPDGRRIATGSRDHTVKVWEETQDRELFTLKGHAADVHSVCFTPDGATIVTGSDDKTAKLWDANGAHDVTTLASQQREVIATAFVPNLPRVFTLNSDGTARLWDIAAGQTVRTLSLRNVSLSAGCISPDSTRLLTAGADGSAQIWDAATGAAGLKLSGQTVPVTSARFSPDGTRIVTGSADGNAFVWNASTGRMLFSLRGHSKRVQAVCFSPEGTRILTASFDNTAKIWDAKTGRLVRTLRGHTEEVYAVCYSADGRHIVTGANDNTAILWNPDNGHPVTVFKGHTDCVAAVCFSPDGSRVLTGSYDNTARLWDASSGQEVLTLQGHSDKATSKGHPGLVTSACFSSDGMSILTGSSDGTAKIWYTGPSIPTVFRSAPARR